MSFVAALPVIGDLIKRVLPDKDAQVKAMAEIMSLYLQGDLKDIESRMSVITAEAQSESFLTANWRPIAMLTFLGLVFASWFGLHPSGMGPDQIAFAQNMLQTGLLGYGGARTVEKSITTIAGALKR